MHTTTPGEALPRAGLVNREPPTPAPPQVPLTRTGIKTGTADEEFTFVSLAQIADPVDLHAVSAAVRGTWKISCATLGAILFFAEKTHRVE